MKHIKYLLIFLMGLAFAIVLHQAQLLSWLRIQRMFALAEPHLFLVIASAVATGILSTLVLKRLRKTAIDGQPWQIKERPFRPGIVGGGLIFGIGWYLTGACPGPVYALIGAGAWPALWILGGSILGAFLYALLKPRLPA